MKPLRAGWIGRCPGQQEQNSCRLVALCDVREEERAKARELHNATGYRDYRDMLAKEELDLVVVKTPTPFHAEQVLAGLGQGLPVFAEKPLCRHAAEIESITAALRETGQPLQINLELRHSTVPHRIHELARAEIGRPIHFYWSVLDEGWSAPHHPDKPWKLDAARTGGFINEKLCHYLDLAQWWLGSRIERVSACGAPIITSGYRGILDNVSVHGWCEGGQTVFLHWSDTAPARKTYRGAVIGDRGAVFWDWWLEGDLTNRLVVTKHVLDDAQKMRETLVERVEEFARADQIVATHNSEASLREFCERLQGSQRPRLSATADEVIALTKLCLAAESSARQRGEPLDPQRWYAASLSQPS